MVPPAAAATQTINLAAIGLGSRAAHMCRLIGRADADVRLTTIVDPNPEPARARAARAELPGAATVDVVPDIESLGDRAGDLHGLVIGTPCHLHAPLAVQAAALGLPLFLEKPVATSWDQVRALAAAYEGREASIVVSFPLRLTAHVQTAMNVIRSGRLGVITQVQAINNVPYGGVYFGQWYRDYDKVGGLWLQKATHDFDYISYLLRSAPETVTAMHSRRAYGGTMPHDLVCSRCDRNTVCPESPVQLRARGDDGGTLGLGGTKPKDQADHACCFSDGIRNQDAGSAILMYASGAHASYTQNFIARRSAGLRGATIIGYDATLRFDWQSDAVTVIDHHRDRVDRIPVNATGSHGGGDTQLARNFVDVLRGRDVSRSPLSAGLTSAAACLAARDAANTGIAQRVPHFGPTPEGDGFPRVAGGPIEPA